MITIIDVWVYGPGKVAIKNLHTKVIEIVNPEEAINLGGRLIIKAKDALDTQIEHDKLNETRIVELSADDAGNILDVIDNHTAQADLTAEECNAIKKLASAYHKNLKL